ncbi:hypothetical protein CPB84DRAFT_1758917 [Gymnopilus junonius]|uniref:Uncharacterized protein n=1 Tax=Gymnopilus junonius TaxID=109634 RepID=A0A9P5P2N9_GYMJU|nr:hypothetical protein CPB84DRAFT_1758917 [Gymnopilus junonius]
MATLNVLPTPIQHPHPHPPNPSLPRPDGDVYNNTLFAPEQHIKARTPPPAYASLTPRPGSPVLPPPLAPGSPSPPPSHSSASSSSSQRTWPEGHVHSYAYSDTPYLQVPTLPSHAPPEFGPTPLTSGHPLLVVPHAYIGAPGAADRRARWRFVGSVFCAVVLLMGLSGLVGLGVLGEWGGGESEPRPSRGRVCWGLGAGC